ncbi:serine-rich adhesin for platelets-like [Ptychodera flava]|uniref:serine-rich adhesin for platelets-like n=1 Tax=Ptychodera flava TaxID=63121 RepID=UPI00396A3463
MNEGHSQAFPKHGKKHKYAAVNNRTSSESSGTSCSLEEVSLESSSLLGRNSTTGSDVNQTELPPNDDVTYTVIGSEIGSIAAGEEALYDKIDRSGRRYREEQPANNEYVTAASLFIDSELSGNDNGSLPCTSQETDTATAENSNELRPPVAPKPRKRRMNTVQNKPTNKKSSTRRDYEEVPDETCSLLEGNPTTGNDVGQVDHSTDEDTTSSPTDPETNLAAAEEETFYDKVDRYGKQYRGERPADNEYATAGNHHIDSQMSGNENDSLASHKQPSQKATVSEVNKIRVSAPPKPPRQYKYAVVNKPTSKQPSVNRHNYEDVPDETSSLLERKPIAGNDVSPEDLYASEDCASGATDPDHVNAEGTMRIKQERSSKKKKPTLHHKYEILENPDDVDDLVKVSPEPCEIPTYATVNKCSSKQSSAKPHNYADVLGEMRSLLKRKQSTENDVSPTERSSNEDITSDETGPDNRSSEPDVEASYSKVDRSRRLYRAGRPVIHKYEDLLSVKHDDDTFATENESPSTYEECLADNTTKQDGGSHYSEVDLIDGRNSTQRYLDVDRTGKKYRQKDGEKRSKYDNLTHHDDVTAYNDLDLNKIKKRSKPKTMPSEEQYNVLGENQATSPKYDKLGFFSFRKKRGTSEKKVIARGYSDV